eukprot:9491658-Pyramimonas_sp.AAC.1
MSLPLLPRRIVERVPEVARDMLSPSDIPAAGVSINGPSRQTGNRNFVSTGPWLPSVSPCWR